MGKFKDGLYNSVVKKDKNVRYEYERYVREHTVEHYEHRFMHWKILLKLCWHYRVKKNSAPLLYFDKNSIPPIPMENPEDRIAKESARKVKMPYINGSESELAGRLEPQLFAKKLLAYDVISFDIFDTLIFRPFSKPATVFSLVANEVSINNFEKIRTDAEEKERCKKYKSNNTREISIFDIYNRIEKETGLDSKAGAETEFNIEKQICYANPYMYQVFLMLKDAGKRIIAVSDMYYPEEYMKDLLKKAGYEGFEKIYVSCDYDCSKIDARLYDIVKQDYYEQNIVHVGDNINSDLKKAEEKGIKSVFYNNVNILGNKFRADGMTEIIGSAYSGIVNNQLYNGLNKYSSQYEYGFIYGGIYVLGYCGFICKLAEKENIDKVIFLSRDGEIYKKCFDALFGGIRTEYLLWSRVAGTKYCINKDRAGFYKRNIEYKAGIKPPVKISSILSSMDLDFLIREAADNFHTDELTINNAEQVQEFLNSHIQEIEAYYKEQEAAIKTYVSTIIGNASRVIIVDVGWNGSGPLQLKEKIESDWKMNCVAYPVIAASVSLPISANDNHILNENLHVYMFSDMMNRNHFDYHRLKNKGLNSFLFEMFTQSCSPSFTGIKNNEFEFQFPEIENYEIIKEIHRGIFDFCLMYKRLFADFKYLLNVSGYDAYCPFRLVARDMRYFEHNFSDYLLCRYTGYTEETGLETLNDLLTSRGVV